MGRVLILAGLLYGYGDAGLDGHRPASLDRPLRNFHRAVDITASNAQRTLIAFDDRVMPALPALADRLRRAGEAIAPGFN